MNYFNENGIIKCIYRRQYIIKDKKNISVLPIQCIKYKKR